MTSIPVVTNVGDLIRLHWQEEQIRVELDRFDEGKDSISAELVVYSEQQPQPGLLHRARLNLISSTARRTLRKILEERVEALDWHAMLEQLCILAVERYRDGDPAIDLRTVDPYSRPRWLISPYVEMSGPTVLYADGGSGKSVLALWIALQVALGTKESGRSWPVLYCDWETDAQTHAERMVALCAGMHIDRDAMPLVLYKHMTTSLSSARGTICKEIQRGGAGMVILDSLGVAGDGAPEESGTAIRIFQSVRTFPVPTLCIHHKRKPTGMDGDNRKASAFGSVYFTNLARMVWDITASASEDRSHLAVSLVNVKANNGQLQRRHAFRIDFENSTDNHLIACRIAPIDPADDPGLAENMNLGDRILADMKHGPRTVGELAEAQDKPDGTIRTTLNRLQKIGLVTKTPEGEWSLQARAVA